MDPERRRSTSTSPTRMEPWDGPASIAFTDGTVMGAVLDRNGLRPSRYWVTNDGLVVMASEVGVVDLDPASIVEKGPTPARAHVLDRYSAGRIIEDNEIKSELTSAHPYADWLESELVAVADLPEGASTRLQSASRRSRGASRCSATRKNSAHPDRADGSRRHRTDRFHGYRYADRRAVESAKDVPTTSPGCSPRSRTRHSMRSARRSSRRSSLVSARKATCSTLWPPRAGRSISTIRSSPTPSCAASLRSTAMTAPPVSAPPCSTHVSMPIVAPTASGPQSRRSSRRRWRGDRRRGDRARHLRSRCPTSSTADPVAACLRRPAPPPGAKQDPYPGRARGRSGRCP